MTKPAYLPDSGDIMWLDLNPRTGHEQSGRRPCLVLSTGLFTQRTGMVVICPITSKIKGMPFEIELHDTKTRGAILPIHVRSIDLEARHATFIERTPPEILAKTRSYVGVIIN